MGEKIMGIYPETTVIIRPYIGGNALRRKRFKWRTDDVTGAGGATGHQDRPDNVPDDDDDGYETPDDVTEDSEEPGTTSEEPRRRGRNPIGTPISATPLLRGKQQIWITKVGPNGGILFKDPERDNYIGVKDEVGPRTLITLQHKPLEFTLIRGNKATKLILLEHSNLLLEYNVRSFRPSVKVCLNNCDESDAQEWIIEYQSISSVH